MKDVNALSTWYHVTPGNPKSVTKWAQGPLRKGVYSGQHNMSLLLFDPTDEAFNGDVSGMALILTRDVSYGDGPVTLTIAPAKMDEVPTRYISREDAEKLAFRENHHVTSISGQQVVIPLPLAMLPRIVDDQCNAILIYTSEDEQADTYTRFIAGAVLRVYNMDEDGLRDPVWTRSVTSGGVISDETHSHVWDILELIFEYNMRQGVLEDPTGTSPIGISKVDGRWTITDTPALVIGDFSDWGDVMTRLQTKTTALLTAEGRDPATITWQTVTAGMAPSAAVFMEIRNRLGAGGDGDGVQPDGTMLVQIQGDTRQEINPAASLTWEAPEEISAGYWKTSEKRTILLPGGPQIQTITTHHSACGGWAFTGLSDIESAKLQLTVNKADDSSVLIRLYGLQVAEKPAAPTPYRTVFGDTVLGDATVNVGETAEIPLTAEAVGLLKAGTVKGLGISYTNDYVVVAAGAALLVTRTAPAINETEENG